MPDLEVFEFLSVLIELGSKTVHAAVVNVWHSGPVHVLHFVEHQDPIFYVKLFMILRSNHFETVVLVLLEHVSELLDHHAVGHEQEAESFTRVFLLVFIQVVYHILLYLHGSGVRGSEVLGPVAEHVLLILFIFNEFNVLVETVLSLDLILAHISEI